METEHAEQGQLELTVSGEAKVRRPKRPRVPRTKRANELDGRTWQRNSISVWSDIRKTSEEIKLGHPAIFPLQLVLRIIQCFTTVEDRIVLDPFAGIGSTAIAAELLGKVGIAIEISKEYCEKATSRQPPVTHQFDESGQVTGMTLNGTPLAAEPGERRIYNDNAANLLKLVEPASVDLVVTSPPYWDILLQERSADQKEIRHYGTAAEDLGRIADYQEFLLALKAIFRQVHEVLKPGKYCIVIVMDLRKKDTFYPYHSDLARFMQELGFIYDDIIIWDRRLDYSNMRPLGYPYKFRINKAHEFILIFQKPGQP